MADDLTLGLNNTSPPANTKIATDEDTGASRHFQGIKVMLGADGSFRGYDDKNVVSTVLASTARTATTNSTDQTKLNGRGLMLLLNVTVEQATETLSVKIQAKDPVGNVNYADIVDFGVVYDGATDSVGLKVMVAYPGVVDADHVAAVIAKSVHIPYTFRVVVTHSAGGSWTYSLAAVALE